MLTVPWFSSFHFARSDISIMGGSQTSFLLVFKSLCFTYVCQCCTETPSILGRHNQGIEVGLEYQNASSNLALITSFLQCLISPYWACVMRTQRCWELSMFDPVAATWVKFEINLT